MEQNTEFQKLVEFLRKHPKMIRKHVSVYAYKMLEDNPDALAQEVMAECWADYCANGRKAGYLSRILAKMLDNHLNVK